MSCWMSSSRPHHLHGSIDPLRDAHGLLDEVDLEPSAEAAPDQLVVHRDLLEGEPGDFGGHRLRPG